MEITLKNVAEKVGVSLATVSMVLNDKPGISLATRERVMTAVRDLGYTISPLKQTFGQNNGNLQLIIFRKHGKIVSDTPFFQTLIEGIESKARHNSYQLTIKYISAETNMSDLTADLQKYGTDGILLLGTEIVESDLQPFMSLRLPVLLLDTYFIASQICSVVIDNIEGSFLGIRHLLENGIRKIGYLKSSLPIQNFYNRYEGYTKALTENKISVDPKFTVSLQPVLDGAYEDMRLYLQKKPALPEAFLADNDIIAFGAAKALREKGYRIPEDVSLIGFDDVPFSSMMDPPLTTIRVDKKVFGQLAVEKMIDMIGKSHIYPVRTVLSVSLISRKSVKNFTNRNSP